MFQTSVLPATAFIPLSYFSPPPSPTPLIFRYSQYVRKFHIMGVLILGGGGWVLILGGGHSGLELRSFRTFCLAGFRFRFSPKAPSISWILSIKAV